ncbi:MAG TPA: family 16 glycoside hydrolase [Kofleriaceae bacterium]
MRAWPLMITLAACKVRDPAPVTEPWSDPFERSRLGGDYYVTGQGYKIESGTLSAHGAHNHPLWLRKKLPHDVRVEFDAWSTEKRGDIKVEIFCDGRSYDPDGGAYMATGYEVVFGGWYNQKSIIARMDEHGQNMASRMDVKVVPNQHYHWVIERHGAKISWQIDGKPFLDYDDPHPLENTGHEYLGFNNWETDTWFDNLVVTPL